MKPVRVKAGTQAGQAMVEFVVAMTAVMGVLLLAIVMLGKFNDVRNRALMSSRYVAWERTVWTDGDINKALASDSGTTEGWSRAYGDSALSVSKTDAELKDEVMQRVIVSDRALLSSGDRKDTQLAAVLPAMWKDHGGNPLLASEAAVTVGTASSADPDSSNDMGALARWSIPTVDVAPFKTRPEKRSTQATLAQGQLTARIRRPHLFGHKRADDQHLDAGRFRSQQGAV
jgi:hypothetical protein